MKTCYENQSLFVTYHQVHINGTCFLLALRMDFFFFWKSILIRLHFLKFEGIMYEVFPKNLLAFMRSSQFPSFIAYPKWILPLWYVSVARTIGSGGLMNQSSELRLIISMWSIVSWNIDTFANSFLMFSIESGREVCRKSLHW